MFFFAPFFSYPLVQFMLILIFAAILPALLLMRYVYRLDKVEKEPRYLLLSLLWQGVLAALVAIVLEFILQTILGLVIDPDDDLYVYIMAFVCVAMVEEGCKLFFLYRRTWNDPNFNFRFDGIVYACFVSLGFAAFENVKYVLSYGLSVALPRALLAVPAHFGFAVIMGYFYARARLNYGWTKNWWWNLVFAYVCPVILHGIYDTCCMLNSSGATAFFVVFVIVMYIFIWQFLKHESQHDEFI